MTNWGSIPSVDFVEVSSNYEAGPNTYLRLRQSRKHVRMTGDPSITAIVKTLYDNVVSSGDDPLYISVKETGNDPVWRVLELDVITYHHSGTPLAVWAAMILIGLLLSYLLINSIYYIATGKTIPIPGSDINSLIGLGIVGGLVIAGAYVITKAF